MSRTATHDLTRRRGGFWKNQVIAIKSGWQTKSFEECIEKVTYTPKVQRKEFLDEGAYPIISQEEDFSNGYWDKKLFAGFQKYLNYQPAAV